MKTEIKTAIETAIELLANEITKDTESTDALKLSQAAVNLAHTAQVLQQVE